MDAEAKEVTSKMGHIPVDIHPIYPDHVVMAGTFETFAALHVPGRPRRPLQYLGCRQRAGGGRGRREGARDRQPSGRRRQRLARRRSRCRSTSRLANAKRIVDAVELPLTVDFEGAYSADPEDGGGERRAARRDRRGRLQFRGPGDRRRRAPSARPAGAADRGDPQARSATHFFINARTDLFLKTQTYDDALVDQVIERGKAFADAGASGFFVPRLSDPKQIERVVREVPLPLNVIAFPGAPDKKVWAERRRRADQPRPLPAPGADGDSSRRWRARRSARRALQAPPLHARAGLQHGLAEQPGADAQDQRDPHRLPADRRRGAATSRGCWRRARASPSATTRGRSRRPAPAAESGAPIAVVAKPKISDLAERHRHRQRLHFAHRRGLRADGQERPRRAADSSSRNR